MSRSLCFITPGTSTTHISAGVDVPRLLDDVDHLLSKAGSLGVRSATSVPTGITPAQKAYGRERSSAKSNTRNLEASRPAAIAIGYTGSLTLGAGQFCTNPGLLFVPEDVGLLTAIAEAVSASAGAPMLSGRIFAGYEDAVAEAQDHPGVTELAVGQPGPGPWGATPRVFQLTLKEFAADLAVLSRERFGPAGLVITYPSVPDLLPVLAALPGNLAGTVHADQDSPEDLDLARQVVAVLERVAGRLVFNGWPTGVAVAAAQHHGGPWPATTVPAYTSVGTAAIRRWLVPVAYQNFPPELLPAGLTG